MREDWLVVGMSGGTNAGKTSTTEKLLSLIPNSTCISQDLYFRESNDKNHIYVEDVKHNNWELLTAIKIDEFWKDIEKILERPRKDPSTKNVLLIDGFLVLNYKKTSELCDLKYFFRVNKEVCWSRRQKRTYDPPDVPGYFEKVVWPEYLKNFEKMLDMNNYIVIVSGTNSIVSNAEKILLDINCRLK